MRKKILYNTLFFLCTAFICIGQQEIQSTQYMLNPFLLNPAYSSVDNNRDLKIGYRSQWFSLEGAPVTQYISFHTPIGKSRFARTHPGDFHNWHGLGFVLLKDEIGAYSNTKINASYSYNIGLSNGTKFGYYHQDGLRFALGAFVGWSTFAVDKDILAMTKTSYNTRKTYYPTVDDPTYKDMLAKSKQATFDLSFGGMLYYNETYYLGVSSTQLLESDFALTDKTNLSRHYFISGLVKLQVSEDLYIIPSVISKMVKAAPLSVNYSVRADWQDKLYLGMGYRTQDAITFMTGAQIKWGEKIKHFRVDKHRYQMYIYYSYDHTISDLGDKDYVNRSKGSHEFTLGFLLPPWYEERNAEDTWKGWKRGKRKKNYKHFFKKVF